MMNEGVQYNYNLSEIWQFPMTGRASENGAAIGAPLGGPNPAQFGDSNLNASSNCDLSRLNQFRAAGSSGTRKRRGTADDEAVQGVSTSNGNDTSDSGNKRQKETGGGDEKGETESGGGKSGERKKQPAGEPSKDYIHVRARRGQATDSHSLAERARREKISERMKTLQDLVPGCNKVIGKALVLDEIINYIQSLQRQVEFLSMKLEAVNSRNTPGLEFGEQGFENPSLAFGTEPARDYSRGTSPEWLHMQVGGGFERPS